jgi:hypothetical protein
MNEKEVADIYRLAQATGTDPLKLIQELKGRAQEAPKPSKDSNPRTRTTVRTGRKSASDYDLPRKVGRLTELTKKQQEVLMDGIYNYLSSVNRPVSSRDIRDSLKAYFGSSVNPRAIGAALSQGSGLTAFEKRYGEVLNVSSNPNKGALYVLKNGRVSSAPTTVGAVAAPSVKSKSKSKSRRKPIFPGIKLRDMNEDEVESMMKLLLEEFQKNDKMGFEDIKSFLEKLCGKQLNGASLCMTIRQPLGPFAKATKHKLVRQDNGNWVLRKVQEGEIASSI